MSDETSSETEHTDVLPEVLPELWVEMSQWSKNRIRLHLGEKDLLRKIVDVFLREEYAGAEREAKLSFLRVRKRIEEMVF